MKTKVIRILIVAAVFVICLNLLISFAVTEKPWYERLFITGMSAIGGGSIGAIAGLIIGGIGVALMGTAVGILGWVAFGLLGFSVGTIGGSLYTIITNPHFYDFHKGPLFLVVIFSLVLALAVNALIVKHQERIIGIFTKRAQEMESD